MSDDGDDEVSDAEEEDADDDGGGGDGDDAEVDVQDEDEAEGFGEDCVEEESRSQDREAHFCPSRSGRNAHGHFTKGKMPHT